MPTAQVPPPEKAGNGISPPELCRVLAFPAIGRQIENELWKIEIEGVIYQRREMGLRKRMLLRLLRRFMKAGAADFTSPLFQQRIEAFVADTERGHRPEFSLAQGPFQPARPTLRNGRFAGVVTVEGARLGTDTPGPSGAACSPVQVRLGSENQAEAATSAFLIPQSGISLVSDIDDTIKITNVRQRREMLINTFLRPFEPIAGMDDVYRQLAGNGIVFHYVSSSPWQLFEPLTDLLEQSEFPPGSIHLRNFRLRDHMLRRVFLLHRRGKGGVIRHLLQMFPQRKFLLVGDSGERDPKIYAGLSRQFPDQVLGIMIRLLHDRDEAGLRERFQEHPMVWPKMHLFTSPEDFAAQCQQLVNSSDDATLEGC